MSRILLWELSLWACPNQVFLDGQSDLLQDSKLSMTKKFHR